MFALERESAPFLRRRRILSAIPGALASAHYLEVPRGNALVVETGVGFERAKSAIDWLLERYEPRMVVAAGFAGALDPGLRVGDVLVASEVVEQDEQDWRVALPMELGDLACGRLVTSPRMVATAAAKQDLRASTGALAVDMESAAIAEACQEAHVPCAVVRAISDTAAMSLSPHLTELLAGGQVAPMRVVAALLRRPTLIPELWRLARDTKLAARNLADALTRLIPDTP